MANITAAMVKELRETDRRRHDGLQDRAHRDQRRHRGRDRLAAQEGPRPRPPRRPAASPPRASSPSSRPATPRRSSRSIPRPTSSPATMSSRPSSAKPPRSRLMGNGTRRGARGRTFPGSQTTVKDRLQELIATIGENMTLRRVAKLEVSKGVIATYVHNAVHRRPRQDRRPRRARVRGRRDRSRHARPPDRHARRRDEPGRRSMPPASIQATVERESAILREKNAGKPDHVMQKIVESGLKSYFKEVTLLEQPFVHDPSKTVAQVLKEAESKAGKPVDAEGLRPLRPRRGHREGRGSGLRGRSRRAGRLKA